MSVCTLSGGEMEDEYMKLVPRYSKGEKGRRAIDAFPEAFGALVQAMEETRQDILGDLFQGGITFGENGQFFTPESICQAMAKMNMTEADTGKRILDPACGSGRTLLACADINRNNEFIGQDVDLRCVRMTAINLALRNLYGHVIWGDSLKMEQRLIYRTGFNGKGFIEKVDVDQTPAPVREIVERPQEPSTGRTTQLSLF